MQIERFFIHTSEPGESCFGIAPKALDSINMTFILNKLVLSMVDSEMFLVSEINECLIMLPASLKEFKDFIGYLDSRLVL